MSSIERQQSALSWTFAQHGKVLDRKDRHIATVLAGIRNTQAAPPRQKEGILPEDLIAMLEVLDRGSLRGLRDRSMLLVGFAGGLRCSEIVGLDLVRDQTQDGPGWVEILGKGCCAPRNSVQLTLESGPLRGPDDEAIEVHGRADHRRAA